MPDAVRVAAVAPAPVPAIDLDAALRSLRRLVLRGLAVAGVLVGLWWTLAFQPAQDPAWIAGAVGSSGVARALALVCGGAVLGALAGLALLALGRVRSQR